MAEIMKLKHLYLLLAIIGFVGILVFVAL